MSDEKQITESEETSEEIQEDILVEAEDSPVELDVAAEKLEALPEDENGEMLDYLDSSLFDDIRQVHVSDLDTTEDLVDQIDSNILQKYVDTISDIAGKVIIEGRVIGQNEKEIIMDIGFKSEGVIPRSEFTTKNMPAIGDVVEVYLERLEDENGQTILSKDKADWYRTWNNILDTYSSEGTVLGTISHRIKGGMIVEVDGIQAFLPGSQIDVHPIPDFDELIGKEMEFRIVKVNQLRKNIVISRKALLEDSLMEKRESLLKEIEVGSILDGRVKNITDFGVFVDLGGFDGLLHITDLSWGRVKHPTEMVDVGDEIAVAVIYLGGELGVVVDDLAGFGGYLGVELTEVEDPHDRHAHSTDEQQTKKKLQHSSHFLNSLYAKLEAIRLFVYSWRGLRKSSCVFCDSTILPSLMTLISSHSFAALWIS